ncbi:hypothetical protein NQ117_01245 [Paenibacillus sp. SC116]|nr:hypothetical protein [Paenibacillus sp. SC116]
MKDHCVISRALAFCAFKQPVVDNQSATGYLCEVRMNWENNKH